jgi:hypothetical protein
LVVAGGLVAIGWIIAQAVGGPDGEPKTAAEAAALAIQRTIATARRECQLAVIVELRGPQSAEFNIEQAGPESAADSAYRFLVIGRVSVPNSAEAVLKRAFACVYDSLTRVATPTFADSVGSNPDPR